MPKVAAAPTPILAFPRVPRVEPAAARPVERILLSPPQLTGGEIGALSATLDSGWVAPAGPVPEAFAEAISTVTGFPHVLAVASGTAALHLGFRLLGVAPGDEVWTASLTYIATIAPAFQMGARPRFLDVAPESWTLDPDLLEAELARAARRGKLPRAVVPVDLFGQSADLDTLRPLCDRWGVPMLSDSAEALGATRRGKHAGIGARMAAFSFNGNKIVTAGGGGALASDDPTLIAAARHLATQAKEPAPHYQHETTGFSYGLSSILAAVGLAQLAALPARVAARRAIFERYVAGLGDLPGIGFMPEPAWGRATRWLSVITLDSRRGSPDREAARRALDAAGIEARPVWKPLHMQPVFREAPRVGGSIAAGLFERGLCLPSGSGLTLAQQARVIATLRALWRGVSGLRILYLHQHFSTRAGATGTRSLAMAEALAARGHAVTLACGQYAGAVTGLDGPFRRGRREGAVGAIRLVEFAIPCGNAQGFGARAGAFLRFAGRATALALAEPFDLVIASSTPLTVALPALAARALRRTPFVFEIRDPWPELPRAMGVGGPAIWWGLDRLSDAACRQAAAVVALSDGMAETAIAHGAAPGRVAVLPNGCDLDLFGPEVVPWRPEQVAPWDVLAVYAGAHGPANGLDQLLDAAALLRDTPLRLVLIGEGGEKPRLMAAAAARGLDRVVFLDPLPKPRLAALLAGADIGLQCLAPVAALAEWTAPNKLMDYLAAGLPVVANLEGRAARLLEADPLGPCGVATPPGNAAALAEALVALAADPARRARLGAAARAQAEARWDRRMLAEQFWRVVEAAVPAARAGFAGGLASAGGAR